MADFLKIFFVLCGLVVAFVFGRNYGEKTIMESKEYIKMRSDSASTEKSEGEIAALKKKFQDLLDSADLKKADEVLSKIMTIFLADLSLHLSEEKEKDLNTGKAQCAQAPMKAIAETKRAEQIAVETPTAVEEKIVTKPNPQKAEFKSNEWLLINSRNDSEIRRNLKKIELKDIDGYLKGAPELSFKESEKFLGTFEGRVIDINNKQYGKLKLNLKPIKNEKNQDKIKGLITLRLGPASESTSEFTSDGLGYAPAGLSGVIYSMGGKLLQFYLIEGSRQIAGYLYGHSPNGTTTTIGTFILYRVDQF